MASDDVYASRDEVGKALLANLRDHGNLEVPSAWGRFYNAGTKSNYRFSCANYLRMEAETRFHPHKDDRWYSEEKIEQNHYVLREGAHPVELEYWHGVDSGQGFEGNLRRFYNAEDIENLTEEHELPEGDRDTDREYAFALLHDNGADMEGVPPTNEALFDAMYDYAQKKGLNNFGSKMSAQLFCKTCNLEHDYQNQPLFTDEELRRIESNPKILFYSMKQANNLLQEMEDRERHVQREAQRGGQAREDGPRIPFEELEVTYLYSSIPLQRLSGEAYKEGEVLTGEQAYEFLAQLNAADKEAFDRIQHGEAIDDRTEIEFRYGRFDHGAVPLKLGQLELRNKQTVQEALAYKLNSFRQDLLTSPELRQSFLKLQSVGGQTMSEGKLIENCKRESNECSKALNRLKWEEKAYLKDHPEIEAVNQKRADVYRYVCDEVKQGLPIEFPRPFVLSVEEATEDMGLVADHLDYRQSATPEMRLLNQPSEGSYLIETAKAPEELLREGRSDQFQVAFTQEQAKALADLNELALHIENRGNVEHPYEKPVSEDYRGAAAIEHFLRAKREDEILTNRCSHAEDFQRGSQKEMALSYRGEEFARISYEVGRGQFVETWGKGLPAHPQEQANAELQEAVYQQFRYQGNMSGTIRDLMQEPEIQRPDMETMKEQAINDRPGDKATNDKLYAYYAAIALRDYANDTPEKFQQAVVEQMKADGLSKQKMTSIAKTNDKFDLSLVTGKTAAEKSAAKKRTKKAVVAEVTHERSRGRQREREQM